jgi:ribosomal protein S18 acetylase RimI-like enzyme
MIGKARVEDVPELLQLVHGAYRGETAKRGWTHEADLLGGQRTDAEALQALIDDPRQTLFLARADGALVGCVQVADQGDGVAYLGMLSVDPDRQAAGLGKRLMAEAERHGREVLGAATMRMTVIRQRPELIAYYERRGYRVTGRTEAFPDNPRFGLPRRHDLIFEVMEKPLV